jgi:hypothetical protein
MARPASTTRLSPKRRPSQPPAAGQRDEGAGQQIDPHQGAQRGKADRRLGRQQRPDRGNRLKLKPHRGARQGQRDQDHPGAVNYIHVPPPCGATTVQQFTGLCKT